MRQPACDELDRERFVFPPERRIAVMITLGAQIVAVIVFCIVWFA